MPASFVVYIDESGDEGFRFAEGSSQWFVLSAVITFKARDLETVKLVDKVRLLLGRNPAEHDPLHFRKLKHEHRIPFLHEITKSDIKAVCVFVHKPSIKNVELFQRESRLYFYASRLLLERVSWCCSERMSPTVGGDGSAEIIFSNRGGMKYEAFKNYMEKLKKQSEYKDILINWSVIKPEQITALAAKNMGLQIADAVASGCFFGLHVNQYGFNEDRYARMLRPIIYSYKGTYKGYGIKFFPTEYDFKKESHLAWLSEVYGC